MPLRVEQVAISFPGQPPEAGVLRAVNLRAAPGEAVAIVGPSGSGKSTLLNIVGTLLQPTSGRVFLGDVDVTALRNAALASFRATQIGFVFQDHLLLPQLSAVENVLLPTLAAGAPERGPAARKRAGELLERVGIAARSRAFPAQLSGGERQRVAVARALINRPGLLLCDEPTGNLDRETGAEVVSLLLEVALQDGVTVLMVTHNLEHARRCGRCLQLLDGSLGPCDGVAAEGTS